MNGGASTGAGVVAEGNPGLDITPVMSCPSLHARVKVPSGLPRALY